ncbi:MAG TPA: ABC transporter substrate-binding protein, partial [Thermoguttaceae bacterium]|nr:ABC transporter substrate-binding protein [Thermoguttaceae bacterium]
MARPFHPLTSLVRNLIGLLAIGLCAMGACGAVSVVATAADAPAADELPLYEQTPYDQITLDAANKSEVLKVQRIDFPGRQVPPPESRTGKLTVHFLDDSATEYVVYWRSIKKVELFEQLILTRANELAEARQFEEAYDYFDFLHNSYPNLPGLAQGMEDFLWKEAGASHRAGQYDLALAMLREVYQRNPKRPNLDKALGMATGELIKKYEGEENYAAIRQLLGQLADWFPDQPVVVAQSNEFRRKANDLLDAARTAMQRGDVSEAIRLTKRQQFIWPALEGAKELAETLHQRHPHVVVGVCMPAVDATPGHSLDFGSWRSSRLQFRTLTEFVGSSTDGGRYVCPMGRIEIDALERRVSIDLRPDIGWASGASRLTANDVARRLLAMADPDDAAYRIDWAELLGSLTVRQVYGLDIQLQRTHVRPDALLQTIVLPYTTPDAVSNATLANGPYVVASQNEDETIYLPNRQYFAAEPGQPVKIVERYYAEGAEAIHALKQGEIRVLDRISPWGLSVVREDEELVVARYGAPLVHCLVPNMRRPLTSRRTFRRALIYGIHRDAILGQLTGGGSLPGCSLLSGPFPCGVNRDDPIGYAYDTTIEPRSYDPRLAIALMKISLQEVVDSLLEQGQEQTVDEMLPLILAHPANEIARSACSSIQKQLKLIGIPVALKELPDGMPNRVPDDVDLMYVELALWEPVVDARRLL